MRLNLKEQLQSLKMVAGGWRPQRASLSDSPPQADDYYRQHIKLNLRTEIGKPEADIQLVMTTESVAAQNIERIQRRSRDQGPNAPTGTTTTPSSRR